ncbi:MAG: guanylate kinase [Thiovulaceae bacterium]|nr:guanylate kinase [Sulfurimonadaceae bacterium]
MNNDTGAILILSGPSGAGKSSLIKKIEDEIGAYYFSISTTTRPMRKGEVEGVHYHFVRKEQFENDIKDEHFLEYAVVHGNYYGTSIKPVNKALKEGKLVLFDIDVQGHDAVQNRLADISTSVFVTTPTLKELEHRLRARGTDSQEIIDKRIEMAKREVQRICEYDYLIINDDLDEAAKVLVSIAKAARMKIPSIAINQFILAWENS